MSDLRLTPLAETIAADFAILDLSLNGELSYPVADALAARGVPFVFSTGYAAAILPERFQDVPTLSKPFEPKELAAAIAVLFSA